MSCTAGKPYAVFTAHYIAELFNVPQGIVGNDVERTTESSVSSNVGSVRPSGRVDNSRLSRGRKESRFVRGSIYGPRKADDLWSEESKVFIFLIRVIFIPVTFYNIYENSVRNE